MVRLVLCKQENMWFSGVPWAL